MNDERLWAPWRLDYVTGEHASDRVDAPPEPDDWQPGADHACFLCRAAANYGGRTDVDRQLLVAARGAHALVVLNRYPYNNGHLMVAPLRHVATLLEMSREEQCECQDWLTRLTWILGDRLRAEGFNIGLNLGRAGGAGCPGHLHWHIVPRWAGDSNFMSVVSRTRVIPQSLAAVWELVVEAIQEQSAPYPVESES